MPLALIWPLAWKSRCSGQSFCYPRFHKRATNLSNDLGVHLLNNQQGPRQLAARLLLNQTTSAALSNSFTPLQPKRQHQRLSRSCLSHYTGKLPMHIITAALPVSCTRLNLHPLPSKVIIVANQLRAIILKDKFSVEFETLMPSTTNKKDLHAVCYCYYLIFQLWYLKFNNRNHLLNSTVEKLL